MTTSNRMLMEMSNIVLALMVLDQNHTRQKGASDLPSQHARTLGMKSSSRSRCSWISRLSSMWAALGSSYIAVSGALVLLLLRLEKDPRMPVTLGRSMLVNLFVTEP